MEAMKTFKWIIGWKDKPKQSQQFSQQPQEEYAERIDNPPRVQRTFFPDTMTQPVKYPLPPIEGPRPVKRLPINLLPKRRYRNL